MKTGVMPKIISDAKMTTASKDFNLKLTQDVIALLDRSIAIMSLEIPSYSLSRELPLSHHRRRPVRA